jgi:hypothetical protein
MERENIFVLQAFPDFNLATYSLRSKNLNSGTHEMVNQYLPCFLSSNPLRHLLGHLEL